MSDTKTAGFRIYDLFNKSFFTETYVRRSQALAVIVDMANVRGDPCTKVDDGCYMVGDPKDGHAWLYEIRDLYED